jgi:diguanylate cyclase (GGDEF)-like protein
MGEARNRLAVVVTTGFDEYQSRVMHGIRPPLVAAGITPVMHAYDPFLTDLCPTLISILRHGEPCGVISLSCASAEQEKQLLELLAELALPSVFVGVSSPAATCVRGDNVTGMRELMAHLLDEQGVRRPVLVRGIAQQADSMVRERVFRDEMGRRGMAVDEDLVIDGKFAADVTYREIRRLLTEGRTFDAVVAANDISAKGALSALNDSGLRVPDDVRLTGFDNEELASLNWPGLTTVDQNLRGQGETAAIRLLAELGGEPPAGEMVVPTWLVIRGSSAPLDAVEDGAFAVAVDMAQASQKQLAAQDAIISLNRSMIRSQSLDQVAQVLASSGELRRLGVERCFLGLYEPDPGGAGRDPQPNMDWARLLLDFRGGQRFSAPEQVFAVHRMLPDELRDELDRGLLVFQPLSFRGRPLGYVLFEQVEGALPLIELLRVDLGRTLGGIRDSLDLENEIVSRRHAERELHAEVLTRRQAQEELQSLNADLRRSVVLDGLTRIGNRFAFQQSLDTHWPLPDSADLLTLLMIDVDHFKTFNDHFGHVRGDEALQSVARCLQRAIREPQDLACRYGGEEFAVLLPASGVVAGIAVARRFQRLLAGEAIKHPVSSTAPILTASIGIAVTTATNPEAATTADLIRAADEALYEAKAKGRNQIVVNRPELKLKAPV